MSFDWSFASGFTTAIAKASEKHEYEGSDGEGKSKTKKICYFLIVIFSVKSLLVFNLLFKLFE